ncbi:MAG: sulfotransferase domain-containing protein [Anaerolineales bacterium]
MISKIKNFAKRIVLKTPFLIHLFLRKRFKVELGLIAGKQINNNTHPSIIHFSLNKAATQHTKKILRECIIENGMVPVHINEYAFYTKFPYLTGQGAEKMVNFNHIFRPAGYFYSAFGGFVRGISELEKYKVILMVRDPRDILVSWYYSIAFSHSIPPITSDRHEEYIRKRKNAKEIMIDEHVISESDRVFNILSLYQTELLDKYPHVYLTSYEKMTSNYEMWLRDLLNACELEISDQTFQKYIADNRQLQPKEENIYKHIRKGKPGDYLDKLEPETIKFLNNKFSPILDYYHDILNVANS